MTKSVYIDFFISVIICIILLLFLLGGADFNFSEILASIGELFIKASGR
jgi:small-conductance mechanosensitive channel